MATKKLTKAVIQQARSEAVAYEIRDTVISGLILKVNPSGRKVFMIDYRDNAGQRRKPVIGRFGDLTVSQARDLACTWMHQVRHGEDPTDKRREERKAATIRELCNRFIEEYSIPKNTAKTVRQNRQLIKRHVLPAIGRTKVHAVKRADIADLVARMRHTPTTANRVLCCLRKIFNLAEVWGYRPDYSNPCRHIPSYPEGGETRFITDAELIRIFAYIEKAEEEGLEHWAYTLAVRLQFAFAARMGEILTLQWDWIDFTNRRVVWPNSKTGSISKPLSEEAALLLSQAPCLDDLAGKPSPFVCPSLRDPSRPMPDGSYAKAWSRILKRAKVPHVGTHGIRHRAATDIANSGVPIKVGMQLTAHKTVSQFMRYVHAEDHIVHAAAEHVAARRSRLLRTFHRPHCDEERRYPHQMRMHALLPPSG
ncbi:tyrosine-type recombinase/integrase [Allosphingosinicella vermicomposti]|uniref:tyrosine-type recombinase/integrase n=1 Tax=Allosphingosinicella vermicomposti TaxID=614671 RepID=UPI000D0FD3CE|nr:site-specific integrase [Allosphingosinicella vermicomposti]